MVVDRLLAGCSILVLALGCGSSPEPADGPMFGELGSLYLDYIDLLNGVDRFFCGCAVAKANYADMQECVAAVGGPVLPPLLAECYAGVFDEDESVREYVECQVSEYLQFVDCLEAAGCGGDLDACDATLGNEHCAPLPYEANAALATACLGFEMPPAFACADGGQIAPWYECNFWPDCADGSDEHTDCPGGFQCQSGEMIPEAWRCDEFADCPDGDDEMGCAG